MKQRTVWGAAIGVTALGLIVAWARPAQACTCADTTPRQAYDAADAVFEGRVESISSESEGNVGPGPKRVVLEVSRTWKAANKERLELRTAGSEAGCGYPFESDESYLVYARRTEGGQLETGLCDRTRPIGEADEDLAMLGAGVTPVTPEPKQKDEHKGRTRTKKRGPGGRGPPSRGKGGGKSGVGCQSCAAARTGAADFGAAALPALPLALLLRRRR